MAQNTIDHAGRRALFIVWTFFFFCEGEEGAEYDEEEPLDRRIFEDVVREAGDLQGEEEKYQDAEGKSECAPGLAPDIIFQQNKEDAGEIQDVDQCPDDAAFDEEFDEVVVRVIGAERAAAEAF